MFLALRSPDFSFRRPPDVRGHARAGSTASWAQNWAHVIDSKLAETQTAAAEALQEKNKLVLVLLKQAQDRMDDLAAQEVHVRAGLSGEGYADQLDSVIPARTG